MCSILDTRHWVPPVGPPPLAPPPGPPQPQAGARPAGPVQTGSFSSNITNRMSDLTLTNSKDSKLSLGRKGGKDKDKLGADGEKEKKKGLLGKMKW